MVRKRWKEDFTEVLNRLVPVRTSAVTGACEALEIEAGPVAHAEGRAAIEQMKNGEAGGVDGLTIEPLKTE